MLVCFEACPVLQFLGLLQPPHEGAQLVCWRACGPWPTLLHHICLSSINCQACQRSHRPQADCNACMSPADSKWDRKEPSPLRWVQIANSGFWVKCCSFKPLGSRVIYYTAKLTDTKGDFKVVSRNDSTDILRASSFHSPQIQMQAGLYRAGLAGCWNSTWKRKPRLN